MANLIDAYKRYLKSNEKLDTTLESYPRQLRALDKFLKSNYQVSLDDTESISKVTGYMLSEYYASIHHLSIETRNYYVIVIKGFFKYLVSAGYIQSNPSDILKVLKIKKKHEEEFDEEASKIFTDEQIVSMIRSKWGYNGLRNSAIIALLSATGLRATELCELTIGQYRRIKDGMIYCRRKGDIWRWVPIASFAILYIEAYLAYRGDMRDEEPLFLSNRGKALNRKSLWKAIASIQRSEGIPTGLHMFRHTVLSAVGKSSSGVVARDIGSQKDIKVTNKYLHSTKEERVAAANSVPWGETLEKS